MFHIRKLDLAYNFSKWSKFVPIMNYRLMELKLVLKD